MMVEGPLPENCFLFDSPLDGWYYVNNNEVTLSMIISLNPGTGNVVRLIEAWKQKYNKITVPIPSEEMAKICLKRGFAWNKIFAEETQEWIEALVWKPIWRT